MMEFTLKSTVASPERRRRLTVVSAFCLIALGMTPALAQKVPEDFEITPDVRAAYFEIAPYCGADAARLCSDVRPGNARVTRCVIEHVDELTSPCKEKVSEKLQELFPQ